MYIISSNLREISICVEYCEHLRELLCVRSKRCLGNHSFHYKDYTDGKIEEYLVDFFKVLKLLKQLVGLKTGLLSPNIALLFIIKSDIPSGKLILRFALASDDSLHLRQLIT